MSGPRPTATVLKLIRGENRPARLKDDRPKRDEPPSLPPGTVLSALEQEMFQWLLKHVYLPRVHGSGDGAGFVTCARLWARLKARLGDEVRGDAAVDDAEHARERARVAGPPIHIAYSEIMCGLIRRHCQFPIERNMSRGLS